MADSWGLSLPFLYHEANASTPLMDGQSCKFKNHKKCKAHCQVRADFHGHHPSLLTETWDVSAIQSIVDVQVKDLNELAGAREIVQWSECLPCTQPECSIPSTSQSSEFSRSDH